MAIKHPLGREGGPEFTQRGKAADQRKLAMAWPIEYDPELGDDRYRYRVKIAESDWYEIRLYVDARPAKDRGADACSWFVSAAMLDFRWQVRPTSTWDAGHRITIERVARSQLEQCGDASQETTAIGEASFNLVRRLSKTEAAELAATLERLNG